MTNMVSGHCPRAHRSRGMTKRVTIAANLLIQRLISTHIGMDISDRVACIALLTYSAIAGCEMFAQPGLYPYPSLFGFVPRPPVPRNPLPRNNPHTPRAIPPPANPPPNIPDANPPPNTPDANPPSNIPDANPPPNVPDANPPPNTPNAKPPPSTPDVNPPPNTPDANPPPNTPDVNPPPNTPSAKPPRSTPDVNPPPHTPNANPPPNTPNVNPPPNIPDANPPSPNPDANLPPNTPDVNPPPNTPSAKPPPSTPDVNPPPHTPNANSPSNTPNVNPPPNIPDANPPSPNPDANLPPNTPDVNPPPNIPDANPPPNIPDANPPPNIPDANPPPDIPVANPPPNKPNANLPPRAPSSPPNGGPTYPLYGRGTQRAFSPFPGLSGWGRFVNRYVPPPLPPESPGSTQNSYTPPTPTDTSQDSPDFVEPQREWVYHFRQTIREPYAERMESTGHEMAIPSNVMDNLVPTSEGVATGQESKRDQAKRYLLSSVNHHLTSNEANIEASVSDAIIPTGAHTLMESFQGTPHTEQILQSGIEFIKGETHAPITKIKSYFSRGPVFPNSKPSTIPLEETDQNNLLHGEPFLLAGRSPALRKVDVSYQQGEQVSDLTAGAPFADTNQPFLIEDILISFFKKRYFEGGVNTMV